MSERLTGLGQRRGDASLRRRLGEALSSITRDPKVHALVMDMALAEAGPQVDLENPAQFSLFVDGPLATAVAQLLGAGAAERVRGMLDPDLAPKDMEESGVMQRTATVPAPASRRVLVITCHAAGGLAIQRLLESQAYVARCVPDAVQAIAVCASTTPDVIVADLDWLDVDARELLRLLREALASSMPPVMLIARRVEPLSGVAATVTKPLDRDRLIAALEQVVATGGGDDAVDEPPLVEDESTYDDGSLARLVRETLGQIASPEVQSEILTDALSRAHLARWPEALDELAHFVAGPLRDVVESRLGPEVADQVIVELEPHLRHADVRVRSGMRPKRRRRSTSPDGANKLPTVLLVDDDDSFLHSLSRLLRDRGIEVLCSSDAHAALTLCANKKPQLVVADLHMPGMSGRQLAALMQLTLDDDAPPLVILTADAHAPPTMDWVACVLHKPVDVDELLAVIEEHAQPVSRAAG